MNEQTPDTAPGPYYVSVMKDGKPDNFRLLAGPYETHADALAAVPAATKHAYDYDAKAPWYAYGTVRMKPDFNEPGIFNQKGLM